MKHLLTLLLFLCAALAASAQSSLCLSGGPAPESVDFNPAVINSFLHLSRYRVVLFGEQHNPTFGPEFEYHLLTDLNRTLRIRHVFLEMGAAAAWHFNRYLATGDTAYIYSPELLHSPGGYATFWRRLFEYNRTLPDSARIVIHGIDFERTEDFATILQLAPAGQQPPPSLQPVIDTVRAHLQDKPLGMYTITAGKFVEYDNSGFIRTLRYVQGQLLAHAGDAKAYFGANYPVIRDIATNRSQVMVGPGPRNRTMFRNMRRIVREEGIDRFAGFFGAEHTFYSRASSLANAAQRLRGIGQKDILNIVEFVYNLKRRDGTPVVIRDPGHLASLNGSCKATLLRAHAVKGYKGKADFVVIADAGK